SIRLPLPFTPVAIVSRPSASNSTLEPIAARAALKSGGSSMGVSRQQQSEVFTRIDPLAKLPVFWALEGRRCIISGGSDAAAWKAELLAACGACVEVYADAPNDMMRALAVR